ncbi:iron-siderophore ABC transporter substrate-binding protein [Kineococcus rhizosphaerae]|uniref:Iron complex transport system substrate-binding protein n=1 Tax=Kineococcus rhizosphaerae TaxID=559628 RepID=A0A2T0R0G8_9ACTN|nr:iron-siderophore ABC transporter substrate-binding protein [Kineococcus rhizosphaerae]PRY12596.1 iron complex transport system substrate-binding protein [Kineococcus rhizosphaerae]
MPPPPSHRALPRRRLLTLLAATAGAPALVACGGAADRPATAAAPSGTGSPSAAPSAAPPDGTWVTPRDLPAGWGSGQADGVFPRTVTHAAGRTTIERAPARVVVISTGQLDAVLTLGLVPVGATAGEGAEVVPAYLAEAFGGSAAALGAITELGSRVEPNLEALAALAPDLVLVNAAGKDAGPLQQKLSAIAPTVVTRGTGLYWKQDFQLLADALGRREQARARLVEHQERAAALGTALGGAPTVSLLRKNGDRVRVFGVASFSGSVVEDAGLPRPPGQGFTDDTSRDISLEELALVDGDHLFYAAQGGDETELTRLPLWPTLPVVAAGRAVEVDDDTFFLNTGPTAARRVLDRLEADLRT